MRRYAIRQVRYPNGDYCLQDWQALKGGSHPDASRARAFATRESAFAWADMHGLDCRSDWSAYAVLPCPEARFPWENEHPAFGSPTHPRYPLND